MLPDISEEEIKPVVSVEVSREVLAGYQLDAVLGIAKTFFLHAHKALSLFLTAPYLRQSLKKWGNMIDENTPCSSEENPTTSKISGTPPQKIELVFPKE